MHKQTLQRSLVALRILYGFAFVLIAGTLLVSNFVMESSLGSSAGDSRTINLAGRERMLSQRIAKCVLILQTRPTEDVYRSRMDELKSSFQDWSVGFRRLAGATNSAAVQSLFSQINVYFQSMEEVIPLLISGTTGSQASAAVERLLEAETRFLPLMDAITFQYDKEAKEKVSSLQQLETMLLLLGLTVLVLEFLAVFLPTTRRLSNTISALRESETLFRESQKAASIGSFKADLETGFWESFEVLNSVLGIGPGYQRTSAGWLDLVHAEDRARVEQARSERPKSPGKVRLEYRIVRFDDGQVRWVAETGEVLFDSSGALKSFAGTLQDVTEAKTALDEKTGLAEQLRQSQKMESLGTLAGGVAHDVNNVLATILAVASTRLLVLPPGHPEAAAFGKIVTAAQRGGKVVRSLLAFARKREIEQKSVDFNALIAEVITLVEPNAQAKVEIIFGQEEQLRPVLGDPGSLLQVLLNLCMNAVDAMPDGGTLRLSARNLGTSQIEVLVQDTGVGMTEEVRQKATDPFFTTKSEGKGTGLGLSLAYSIVSSHDGSLNIESVPSKGTTVRMRFPSNNALEVVIPLETASLSRNSVRALSILLVDDDQMVREAVTETLQLLGHRVFAAASGEVALSLVSTENPDLVILDMNMPGWGGPKTLEQLRKKVPGLPVLLATGRVDQVAVDLAKANERVWLLAKPYSISELRAKVAELDL